MIDRIASISATLARCGVPMETPDNRRGRVESEADEPVAVETSMAFEGSAPIQFSLCGGEVYLDADWPAKTVLDANGLRGAPGVAAINDDHVFFVTANGEASYQKVGVDPYTAVWFCELRDHSYRPIDDPEHAVVALDTNNDMAQLTVLQIETPAEPAATADEPAQPQTYDASASLELDEAGFLGLSDGDKNLLTDVAAQDAQQREARRRRLALAKAKARFH